MPEGQLKGGIISIAEFGNVGGRRKSLKRSPKTNFYMISFKQESVGSPRQEVAFALLM